MIKGEGGVRMLPIGPLMIEHRLIERMIALLGKEGERIARENNIQVKFIDTAVDFIKTYADRCHHGKEEDILFRELDKKKISDEHKRMLKEILDEHQQSRKAVADLEDAKAKFLKGDRESLSRVVKTMQFLVGLYARHIEKEDKHFFPACMEYFTQEEKDAMLAQEYEFDKGLIHQMYKEKIMNEEACINKK
jgi:hemerythrin-like domain-containing protein